MAFFLDKQREMLLLLLLLLMLLILSPPLIQADLNLIKTLCRNSDTPATCMKCVTSSENALVLNSVGIATSLVDCTDDQAKILGASMEELATNSSNDTRKPIYQTCANDYRRNIPPFLVSAKFSLREHNYEAAEYYVLKARRLDLYCHRDIESYKDEVQDEVYFNMTRFEEFADSACRIIEKIYA
ncbi:putative pectinesterase inhibitor domain-containing protein [Medicago truncatula]|uniref:Plant invertase/pectin methylesterase inhibitor n=1 Tax=Medicago truncatula TaxID=3880 RepID=A0A072V9L1_MEDTR|nr:uncharacterized protein LOC25486979 [Medicago truncatula]KEH38301.1 plant invertase/pectin methylesterase inhibitor [Medicago truncatula]RHN74526.1 putative pectinesterase inhibitor domain-containing protein [Medicago truncatula]